MTLRKITIDNSVQNNIKAVSLQSENNPFSPSLPNTRTERSKIVKCASIIIEKKIYQNNKKFIIKIGGGGFRIIKLILNCYFYLKNILIPLFNKQKQKHMEHSNLN